VVGHELTHGAITHTSNLEYRDEPGALHEHFADVFGSLVKQWRKHQTADEADWLIGNDILGPDTDAVALRTFTEEPADEDDPLLGTDPQPKHMDDVYRDGPDPSHSNRAPAGRDLRRAGGSTPPPGGWRPGGPIPRHRETAIVRG
jgi:Zn-dependent metalloprotease